MRSTLEIEGTWEEIMANANDFSGKRVRLTLFEQNPTRESDLLKEINLGVSTDTWAEYHRLIAKCQAEILTDVEQEQLIEISDRLEVRSQGMLHQRVKDYFLSMYKDIKNASIKNSRLFGFISIYRS